MGGGGDIRGKRFGRKGGRGRGKEGGKGGDGVDTLGRASS